MAAPRRLRDLEPHVSGALVVLTLAGFAMRAWHAHGRAPQGDDVGTLIYVRESYGFLLSHFRDPWLSMNVYLAIAKALHDTLGVAAIAWLSVAAGTALVPVTAACALRVAAPPAALAAAALVAGNAYLVDQSAHLRVYALFACAATAALTATFDWARHPTRSNAIRTGAWGSLAVLLHANGIFLALPLALIVVAPMGQPLAPARDRRAGMRGLLAAAGLGAVLVGAVYAPLAQDMAVFRPQWSDTPPTSVAWIAAAVSTYFGAGYHVLPLATLFGVGAWAAIRHATGVQAILTVITLTVLEIALAGYSHLPWGHARMANLLVPPLLLVAATGVSTVARTATPRALVVGLVLANGLPDLAGLAARQRDYPWAAIAEVVRAPAEGGSVFAQLDAGQRLPLLHLRPFLGDSIESAPSLAQLVRRAPDTERTLILLNPHEPIATTASQRTLGKVQIITYGPLPVGALAAAVVTDLERLVDDPPAPERTGALRLLLDVRRALGRPDDDGRITGKYHECLARTARQRSRPPQQMAPVER